MSPQPLVSHHLQSKEARLCFSKTHQAGRADQAVDSACSCVDGLCRRARVTDYWQTGNRPQNEQKRLVCPLLSPKRIYSFLLLTKLAPFSTKRCFNRRPGLQKVLSGCGHCVRSGLSTAIARSFLVASFLPTWLQNMMDARDRSGTL